jgi:flagellar hook assembly protein FlgD
MRATVRVYDLTGRTIRTLADRLLPAGTSTLTWDGRDDAGATPRSGMYFARLTCAAGDRSVRTPIVR